jgi:hypothetical protein
MKHYIGRFLRSRGYVILGKREVFGKAILAQLDPIVENKLEGNAALNLKWENVRKVERRWVYKTSEEATPVAPAA